MKPSVICLIAYALSMCACAPHNIAFSPLTVEPIHVTIDVTIHDESEAAKPTAPADGGK